ncbi:hypothetical protein [Salisediminibacterium selenitireducens]|uniref:ATP-binding protein n=1 Tax=Bacillus selenitireducens (strain ATCC 700615 / DSM 15326 / MLS10) TaxID=439292 RepID=D6XVC7_BACIE|nr:hypothetical protein [Salisediminibacterium selenitireducens]ADH99665.1 hypothetical protein Bsel_2161 [[Bacillus] selenitireducens MLS10]
MTLDCLVVTGHFGSGKTEFALLKALEWREADTKDVALCDLDVINPYFRAREMRAWLEKNLIDLVAPKVELMQSDLPVVSPKVSARLKKPNQRVIIDAGGGKEGALAVGQFSNLIANREYELWFVANLNRPEVSSAEKILSSIQEIETTMRLKVSGIIHNTHLAGDPLDFGDIQKSGGSYFLRVRSTEDPSQRNHDRNKCV